MDDTSIQSVIETQESTNEKNLAQIENDIKLFLNQTTKNFIEIGRRLIQAKSLVPHGQWQLWLENNFQLTKRSAQQFMQCAERFGKNEINFAFSSTQMIAMLALPEDDTQKFIEEHDTAGSPVQNMTVKNLRSEIRKWNSKKNDFHTFIPVENDKTINVEASFLPVVHDDSEQSECNESDIVIINNPEPKEQSSVDTQQPSSQSQSHVDETPHNNDDELTVSETSTEVKENYLIDDISTMCASLIQSENRNEIIQSFAKNNPNQLDTVIKNLTTIISELQSIRKTE